MWRITGQQWYSHIALYDLKNRFYSPDAGRFLQGDPSGFKGDATNLYRYCGNNPLMRSDPSGLHFIQWKEGSGGGGSWHDCNDGGGAHPFPLQTSGGASGVSDGLGFGGLAFYGGATLGLDVPGTGLVANPAWGTISQRGVPSAPTGLRDASGDSSSASSSDPPPSSTGSNPLGFVGNILGKIWELPNTIIGLAIGLASLPFGGQFDGWANNAFQFTNVPFGSGGALTLGNVQLYNGDTTPDSQGTRYDGGPGLVPIGPHEQAHTYQAQVLGAFFLPFYLLNGGISASNPLENAADNFAQGLGSWWPGGH